MKFKRAGKTRWRDQKGSSQIAEFGPVFYISFLLFLAPVLDLSSVFVAGVVQYLATNDIASKAATQADYVSALNSMTSEAYQFQATGLARFVHLVPAGGYTGCGDDLYVLATNVKTGSVSRSSANQALTQLINASNTMYEISVESTYTVEPLLNLSSVPLIGMIPGLGKPVELAFTVYRPFEHLGGLQPANGSNPSTKGSAVQLFQRIASIAGNVPNPALASIVWRTPKIYQMIKAAGQTIVAENVVLVDANNPSWTSAGVLVSPGDKIYVDTQAVGIWNANPEGGVSPTDANGYATDPPQSIDTNPALSGNSLDGKVGSNGQPFLVGNYQYNYVLPGSGIFSLIMNDNVGCYGDNTGAQFVRVIVVN